MTDTPPLSVPPKPRLGRPLLDWLRGLKRRRAEDELRYKLEELIDEVPSANESSQEQSERLLLSNILAIRDRQVGHVMVPRADVVAIEASMKLPDIFDFANREGHSRYPVYRGDLDDTIGMIHIKDLLPFVARPQEFDLTTAVRDVIVVAPTMPVLELLVEMRQSRRHMALIVDEFGGIDGLVTIEDLVEEIVGEIEDEHDESASPHMILRPDGSVVADGRLAIDELEARCGRLLDDEAREDVETLGGLLFFLAGRVPSRGEIIRHDNGVEFEVIESDSRRVKKVRIRHLPPAPEAV